MSNLDYVAKTPVLSNATFISASNSYNIAAGGNVLLPVYPYDNWLCSFKLNGNNASTFFVGDSRMYHQFEFTSNQPVKYTYGYEGQTVIWNGTASNYMTSNLTKQATVRIRNGLVSLWYDNIGQQGTTKVLEQDNANLRINTFAAYDYGYFQWRNPSTSNVLVQDLDVRNITVFENPTVFNTELYADTSRARVLVAGSNQLIRTSGSNFMVSGTIVANWSNAVPGSGVSAYLPGRTYIELARIGGNMVDLVSTSAKDLIVGNTSMSTPGMSFVANSNTGKSSIFFNCGPSNLDERRGQIVYYHNADTFSNVMAFAVNSSNRMSISESNISTLLPFNAPSVVTSNLTASNYTGITWTMIGSRPTALSQFTNDITVPWTSVSSRPTALSQFTNDIIVPWTSVSSRPTQLSQFTNNLTGFSGNITFSNSLTSKAVSVVDATDFTSNNFPLTISSTGTKLFTGDVGVRLALTTGGTNIGAGDISYQYLDAAYQRLQFSVLNIPILTLSRSDISPSNVASVNGTLVASGNVVSGAGTLAGPTLCLHWNFQDVVPNTVFSLSNREPGNPGLFGGALFHEGFLAENASGETMGWNKARLIIRGTTATNGSVGNAVMKIQQFYYISGWTDRTGNFNCRCSEAMRGYQTTVSPWFSLSTTDVPGLGVFVVSTPGSLNFRFGPVYIEFAA